MQSIESRKAKVGVLDSEALQMELHGPVHVFVMFGNHAINCRIFCEVPWPRSAPASCVHATQLVE